MSNSTNVNICEKCGATNPVTAKFCFQCGNVLRAPNQPVICKSCSTANNATARFCKFCGKPLYEGDGPQKCPRCNNTVSANAVVCDKCHFRMPIKEQQEEQQPLPPLVEKEPPEEKEVVDILQQTDVVEQEQKKPRKSFKKTIGSFVLSIMFFLLIYLLLGWQAITPSGLLKTGIFDMRIGGNGNFTGMQILSRLLSQTFTVLDIIHLVVIVPSLITAIIGFISNLIKVLIGKQSKGYGWWYVLSSVCIGFVNIIVWILCKFDFMFETFGITKETAGNGALAFIVPSVFLIAFVLTVVFAKKEEKIKEIHR